MSRKFLSRITLSFIFLVAILLSTLITFGRNSSMHAFAAYTPPGGGSGCESTHWVIDSEKSVNYNGTNMAGQGAVYHWDLSVSGLRDVSSGAFCGRASTNVCITMPSGQNVAPYIKLTNELYINGVFTSYVRPFYVVYPGKTYCAPSGSFSATYRDYVTVYSYILTPDGAINNAGKEAIEVKV